MSRHFTPEEAVERYLEEHKSNLADSTLYNYKTSLKQFVEWCDDQPEIEHIQDLNQFHISDFKLHRRDQPEMSNTGLYNVMMGVRVFIRWCESKGLLEDMADNIILPDRGRAARTETLEPDKVEAILSHLDKYEYASARHAQFALMWDTGVRLGALRSLDLDDYHSDEAYIELHHRPDTGTPLKNGRKSERQVNLHRWWPTLWTTTSSSTALTQPIITDASRCYRQDTAGPQRRHFGFASERLLSRVSTDESVR